MDESLAVILPIHNAERTLVRDVTSVLEATAELTTRVEVLILDDASSDDSYEVASELAQRYRQVRVERRAAAKSLSESLRSLRSRVESDIVIVHDGASRVNVEQLRLIWSQQRALGSMRANADTVSFADLRRPAQTHPSMVEAHRRLLGFQRWRSTPQPSAEQTTPAGTSTERTDRFSRPQPAKKRGVGSIPTLPNAKLFGAITDFALGE